MPDGSFNKFRAAAEILQRGRDLLVDDLADEILDQGDDLLDRGFAFNELLETQGTRIHFLTLLLSQLEQSAEILEESQMPPVPPPPEMTSPKKRRRPKAKKLERQSAPEGTPEDS